jgi:hypothetical protein
MDLLQKQNKFHPLGMCRCVMWYIRVHGITSQKPVTSVLAAATTSKLNTQGITHINPSAQTSAHVSYSNFNLKLLRPGHQLKHKSASLNS